MALARWRSHAFHVHSCRVVGWQTTDAKCASIDNCGQDLHDDLSAAWARADPGTLRTALVEMELRHRREIEELKQAGAEHKARADALEARRQSVLSERSDGIDHCIEMLKADAGSTPGRSIRK